MRVCLLGLGLGAAQAADPRTELVQQAIEHAAAQTEFMLKSVEGKKGLPRTMADGKLVLTRAGSWTSGFFPGTLWYLFEATGDAKWRKAAEEFTARLEQEKNNRGTHDVGFILQCSFGHGFRLTGDPRYREVLLAGAESLATRFNPRVGCLKSWDEGWAFPVIIDNMMNLELLLVAARLGPAPQWRGIATAHADTTMRHHFRPDNGSYHVVAYNPETGKVESRQTHQGTADESTWARGQAWALAGYTLMYRETRNPVYLEHTRKLAAFIADHPRLPADKIPYWDFDAPDIPNAPRDASAAAIMSSALIELSGYVDEALGARYFSLAEQMLQSLCSPRYRAEVGGNGGFILKHSTGNLPEGREVDAPLCYADYYFLEALLRYQARLKQGDLPPRAARMDVSVPDAAAICSCSSEHDPANE